MSPILRQKTNRWHQLCTIVYSYLINKIDTGALYHMFFEVRLLAALASWLCRLHRFGLFLADKLGKKFGQQYFQGAKVCINLYCLPSDELKTNIQYLSSRYLCICLLLEQETGENAYITIRNKYETCCFGIYLFKLVCNPQIVRTIYKT